MFAQTKASLHFINLEKFHPFDGTYVFGIFSKITDHRNAITSFLGDFNNNLS